MDPSKTKEFVNSKWDSWFVPGLSEFITIPNLTPMIDSEYLSNGLLDQAIDCVDQYIQKLEIKGLKRHIFKTEQGLPLICYVVDPSDPKHSKTVLLYGHLDKQPHGEGWDEGLAATKPVIKGDLLYGRGSSDDGYASFACMLAVKAI
jgi:acetylornithine deacetylase/succinyl-diaminopimelate desuccinylase-like protein